MSSPSVVRSLKVVYGDDLRRFPVTGGQLPPLAELKAQLSSAYGLPTAAVQLKYVDEEEDLVTVVSDADLHESVAIAAQQGKTIVRLHVFLAEGQTEAKTEATQTTKTDAVPAPKPAPAAEAPKASPPSSTTGEASSSSSTAASKPSAETVLAALKAFFADGSVLAQLPTAVTLFLDTLVSTADVGQAIRFTLDAQPALKATALVTLGTRYLDVALPYIESAIQPLRAFLVSLGAGGMNQIKATIQTVSLFVLPMVSSVVAKLTPATLEQAWAIVKAWVADPSQPFPVEQLKALVLGGGEGAAASGPCGFGPFAGAMRGMFGPRRHHGFGHGANHGAHGVPHPFAGFGCGRGGGWRRRMAEQQAAQAQAQSQQGPAQSPSPSPAADPFVDILSLVGGGVSQAGSGLEALLGSFLPRQPQQQAAASSSAPAPAGEAPTEVVHHHIICDGCGQSPIKGLRYKCAVCPDYDLCSACEAKGQHDASHPLLKLHAPIEPRRGGRCGFDWRKHVHGHHGRHGGWRSEAQQQAAGPSMKFVRDANYADRTPVSANQVLIKRWVLVNDGSSAWPSGAKLIFTRGDREMVDGEEFPVAPAEAGQEVEVSAVLKTPAIPGRYQAFFRLADAERNCFGDRVWCDLFVQPEQQAQPQPQPAAAEEEQKSTEPAAVVVPVVQLNESVASSSSSPVLVKPTIEASEEAQAASLPGPSASSPAPSAPVAEAAPAGGKYATELALLSGMGFQNRELNIFLLDSKQGDIVQVANWLLEKMK